MAQRGALWIRWLALAIGGLIVWTAVRSFFAQRGGPEQIVNRVWLERMPRNPRDMVWHFVAVDHGGPRVGNLGRASRWRIASDGFQWNRQGDRLRGRFPQNDCHLDLQVRTWKCAGQAPAPFELCLELTGAGRVYRYYSRTDWVLRRQGPLNQEIAWLAPALPAAAATMPGTPEETDDGEEGGAGTAATNDEPHDPSSAGGCDEFGPFTPADGG